MDNPLKFQSWRIAWTFFATCLLLLSLQIVYGFIMGFAHMGYDGLHEWLPFNTARATHTNLLVVWLLAGFMGSAYYIIPDEAQTEIWSMKLGWVQWGSLVAVSVTAVIGFHFNYWEDRKSTRLNSSTGRAASFWRSPGRSTCSSWSTCWPSC